ncbi:ABC transporter substrate-binding protein [Actinocrispum wychmicini]|uniref:Peptide/nickel transport system substrate-binding protein n=1 Tax=Actinocrispum wychmicini TaxID=1213861 RepID=A0A4R2ITD9_9PSEU|nr:ABC transporter substrate-binding protein [Actinocrispum wychmicini]TCO47398.1 peptide/nickel transport system substrate-binding protein [Actinocrispum wychmicini]
MNRRGFLRATGGIAVLGPLAVACADTRKPAASGNAVLKYAMSAEPKGLDLATTTESNSGIVIHNVYDRLVELTADAKNVTPGLAERYDISPDGVTYSFALRSGVKFSDGSVLDANAVVASLRRTMEVGQGASFLLTEHVKPGNIVAKDAGTVVITLDAPFAPFLRALALDAVGSVVNPTVVAANKTQADPTAAKYLARNMAGSGAFQFVRWTPNQVIELKPNEGHWRGRPKLGGVLFNSPVEPSTAALQVERGDLDVAGNLPANLIERLGGLADVGILSTPLLDTTYWVFQTGSKPFNDVRVRQAICYAIDHDAIMANVVKESGVPLRGPLPRDLIDGYDNASEIAVYKRDVAKAKALLADAGYANGLKIDSTYVPGYGTLKQIAEVMQANLKDAGIECSVGELPLSTIIDKVGKGDLPFFSWKSSMNYASPDAMLYTKLHGKATQSVEGNIARYQNAEVDQLLDRARGETDRKAQDADWLAASARISKDVPWLPLYQDVDRRAVRKNIRGYKESSLSRPDLFAVEKS